MTIKNGCQLAKKNFLTVLLSQNSKVQKGVYNVKLNIVKEK